jgi:hypothetical protein
MATDTTTDTVAAKADDVDVVSMALADMGMTPAPEKEPEDETEPEETISDNSDETEDTEEKSEESGEDTVTEPEDSEEDEPADTEADAEAPKDKVQKRIDKLVAKQRQSEERATAVTAELEQLKSAKADLEAQLNQTSRPILSPSADNPLADVDGEEVLEQRVQNAQAVRRWALQNSDGTTIKKPDGSEQFISGDEVKGLPYQSR